MKNTSYNLVSGERMKLSRHTLMKKIYSKHFENGKSPFESLKQNFQDVENWKPSDLPRLLQTLTEKLKTEEKQHRTIKQRTYY